MVISSVRTEPPEGRRVFGVAGWQAAVIGLMHHQQLEPARAVLLVDLDAELAGGAAFPELALQFAAQAERRAGAGLADEEDCAVGVADLIDSELTWQARRGLRGQRLPWFVEAQPDRHGLLALELGGAFLQPRLHAFLRVLALHRGADERIDVVMLDAVAELE